MHTVFHAMLALAIGVVASGLVLGIEARLERAAAASHAGLHHVVSPWRLGLRRQRQRRTWW
jgi:hypothetical protein